MDAINGRCRWCGAEVHSTSGMCPRHGSTRVYLPARWVPTKGGTMRFKPMTVLQPLYTGELLEVEE